MTLTATLSHSRNCTFWLYKRAFMYEIPIYKSIEMDVVEYRFIKEYDRLKIYAFPAQNKNITLLQKKNVLIPIEASQLLRKEQGETECRRERKKEMA